MSKGPARTAQQRYANVRIRGLMKLLEVWQMIESILRLKFIVRSTMVQSELCIDFVAQCTYIADNIIVILNNLQGSY